MSEDWLSLAAELATGGPSSGRPKAVYLRRATSTAYYALFHAMARLCAERLVGWSKPWRFITPIYRSLEHRKSREVCNEMRRDHKGQPLGKLATAFVTLQDLRHEADYSPEPFSLNRSDTIELVRTAEQAVTLLGSLSPDEKLALAVRLIARHR